MAAKGRVRANPRSSLYVSKHDGIPWNNNNAEHAIKAFARLRNVIGGTSTFKGMREYLILLSISETCTGAETEWLAR